MKSAHFYDESNINLKKQAIGALIKNAISQDYENALKTGLVGGGLGAGVGGLLGGWKGAVGGGLGGAVLGGTVGYNWDNIKNMPAKIKAWKGGRELQKIRARLLKGVFPGKNWYSYSPYSGAVGFAGDKMAIPFANERDVWEIAHRLYAAKRGDKLLQPMGVEHYADYID